MLDQLTVEEAGELDRGTIKLRSCRLNRLIANALFSFDAMMA
jgi:hypothetical protein